MENNIREFKMDVLQNGHGEKKHGDVKGRADELIQ